MLSALKVEFGGEQLKESSNAPPPAGASSVVMTQLAPVRKGRVFGWMKLTIAVPVPFVPPDGPVVVPPSRVNRREFPTAALAEKVKLFADDSVTAQVTEAPFSPSTIRGNVSS
jgi:hypothetical protein